VIDMSRSAYNHRFHLVGILPESQLIADGDHGGAPKNLVVAQRSPMLRKAGTLEFPDLRMRNYLIVRDYHRDSTELRA
jgi:hypothetical protein